MVIFIEIIIIGFFTSTWLLLLLARFGVVDPPSVATFLEQTKGWETLIIMAAGAVAY